MIGGSEDPAELKQNAAVPLR